MSRNEKLAAGFLSGGFEFKGVHYKPLTAQTLLILERVKSPFFTGAEEGMRGLLDFLFVSSRPCSELLPLLKDGDAWELAILEFAADFTSQDLNELGHLVAEANEDIASAVVEVKEDGNAKKKPAMNRRGGPT